MIFCEYKTKAIQNCIMDSLDKFISDSISMKRKVVFITSGGTSVPLEKNTVR